MKIRKCLLVAVLLTLSSILEAKVVLPNLLSDNAVLQRNTNVLLWGKATPNKVVTITPSWSNQHYTTKANAKGDWSIEVATGDAGVGYSITFDDGEKNTINNILLGEVWLCSGQSNMDMTMSGFHGQPIEGAANKIAKAKSSTPIRYYKVERGVSNTPQSEAQGSWGENTPEVVAAFSATAYYFAEYIQEVLDVPVGVIVSSWGGTRIEAWMNPEMLQLSEVKKYDFSHLAQSEVAEDAHRNLACLYNAMIHPLLNYKFKGMLWYQGETNRFNWSDYKKLFPQFVAGLRKEFNCGNFPFYYAQIAPFKYLDDNKAAAMRSVQSELSQIVDNCGMITLLDVGEKELIHPRNKQVVGERFAYWALGDSYQIKGIKYNAPQYQEMKIYKANDEYPKRIAIKFMSSGGAICFNADQSSSLFEVAGADKKFYPAQVRYLSTSKYPIEVWSDKVAEPVAVRYGFRDYVKGDVFNNQGLPLSSFRSDNWELE